MKEATSKPVKLSKTDNLNLSWRDTRYHRFYEVVDQLVDEIQEHVWAKTGKPKRRLKGDGLGNLHYSVECLVRDCVAVVSGVITHMNSNRWACAGLCLNRSGTIASVTTSLRR